MDRTIGVALLAVIVSLLAGLTVVLARTVNARLSQESSPLVGSLINHIVGLPFCLLLLLGLQRPLAITLSGLTPWMFLGGVFGVLTVCLFNVTVPRVSAFQLTLLAFIGQVFAGIILDFFLGKVFSFTSFMGGLLIALGLLLNMFLKYFSERRKETK